MEKTFFVYFDALQFNQIEWETKRERERNRERKKNKEG